ncbi:phosphate ABC transporter permease subunit PstC [Kitasatospora sp. NBC_00240]|uniref:phosphate ABC transporter permease subunit PstC n=1 Tax=Kitasatospora sp. NBC_00240 TaxID=2903567 RepID=UPI0022511777|nr:phosphate ABC transporter permease subunit PstC [Kitasatospora sp. NBC_00240]MCX5214897.1 phosphate ABC transporter permease subunit PstC [Kitasatospora sp. NBC_00240]
MSADQALLRPDTPRTPAANPGLPDQLFLLWARCSGAFVLLVMLGVGGYLAVRAARALHVAGLSFLTTESWNPDGGHGQFGIAAVLVGTVLIGGIAVVLAVPLALGSALYISEYAPRKLRRTLIGMVDLMAAVPSVVYGVWGFVLLQYQLTGVARWVSTWFGWIPLFKVNGVDVDDPLTPPLVYTASSLMAGTVVAFMITPIMCSIMREVFDQAPAGEREGAYALGSTRWGMIRSVVLPFGRGGIIGGTMLGLGRALGETITVYLILSMTFEIQPHILQTGGSAVAPMIALRYGDSTPFSISALMAAGLALFLLTLVVNFAAAAVVARSRSGAST